MADNLRPLADISRLFAEDMQKAREAIQKFTADLGAAKVSTPRKPKASAAPKPPKPPKPPVKAPPVPKPAKIPKPIKGKPVLTRWQRIMQAAGVTPGGMNPKGKGGLGAALGGGKMGGMASKAAGVAGIVVEVGKKLYEIVNGLKDFANQTAENTRGLRQFNSTINAQWALMDRQQIQLQFRTAKNTSASTKDLLEETRKMREALQPLKELGINATNKLATAAAQTVTFIAGFTDFYTDIHPVYRAIKEYLNGKKKEGEEAKMPIDQFFAAVARGDFAKPRNGRDK